MEERLGGVYRQGERLVFHENAELPHRCLRCNRTADVVPRAAALVPGQPALVLLVGMGCVLYVLVRFFVVGRADARIPLCATHAREKTLFDAFGWLSVLGAIALFWFGVGSAVVASMHSRATGIPLHASVWMHASLAAEVVGGASFLLALLLQVMRPLAARRVEKGWVWVAGVHADYLTALPWPQTATTPPWS